MLFGKHLEADSGASLKDFDLLRFFPKNFIIISKAKLNQNQKIYNKQF